MTIDYNRRFAVVSRMLTKLGDNVTPDDFFGLVNFYLGITKRKGRVKQLEDSPQIAPIVYGVINKVYGSGNKIPDSLIDLYREAEEIIKDNFYRANETTLTIYKIISGGIKDELNNPSGRERLQ